MKKETKKETKKQLMERLRVVDMSKGKEKTEFLDSLSYEDFKMRKKLQQEYYSKKHYKKQQKAKLKEIERVNPHALQNAYYTSQVIDTEKLKRYNSLYCSHIMFIRQKLSTDEYNKRMIIAMRKFGINPDLTLVEDDKSTHSINRPEEPEKAPRKWYQRLIPSLY